MDATKYEKLTAFCAYQERCIFDVKEKAKKIFIEKEAMQEYIARLEEDKFLSEERYAKDFIKAKVKRGWGEQKIKMAFGRKRVSATVYTPFLKEINQDGVVEKITELATRKLRSIKEENAQKRKQKLIAFLRSRGYAFDKILLGLEAMGKE